MTGMKSGAGDDPFADVGDDESDESLEDESTGSPEAEIEESTDDLAEGSLPDTGTRGRIDDVPLGATGRTGEEQTGEPTEREPERLSVEELPYIARRNVRGESVKTGRDKNVLFELRPEIAQREEEFVDELEARLGTDVPKTDAREAALAAIWDRPELVVPVLEEWGLGYFEE